MVSVAPVLIEVDAVAVLRVLPLELYGLRTLWPGDGGGAGASGDGRRAGGGVDTAGDEEAPSSGIGTVASNARPSRERLHRQSFRGLVLHPSRAGWKAPLSLAAQ